MKNLILIFCAIALVSCHKLEAQKHEFKETINKTFTVKPTDILAIYNVHGPIKIEGYEGDKVQIEVEKTISAKNNADLEMGKKEFDLVISHQNDSLIAYIKEPNDSRPHQNNNRNDDQENKYLYKLNFTIKVPKSMNMAISTITNGDINIANIDGKIKANNINGKIILENVKQAYDVHTINGDVSINFVSSPPDNAKFYTLNGKMTIKLPTDFSADCSFKSFQGEFFTDFENTEKLPNKIIKTTVVKNGKTIQKLNKTDVIRFGSGGKNINFETFNGNIYIKKG
jgi:DUF4097 and DUF4098 domain-containing protein YvlB